MAEKTRTTISETTVTSKGNTCTRYLVRYDPFLPNLDSAVRSSRT